MATTSCPPGRCSSSETTALPNWPLAPHTPIFISTSNVSLTNKLFACWQVSTATDSQMLPQNSAADCVGGACLGLHNPGCTEDSPSTCRPERMPHSIYLHRNRTSVRNPIPKRARPGRSTRLAVNCCGTQSGQSWLGSQQSRNAYQPVERAWEDARGIGCPRR